MQRLLLWIGLLIYGMLAMGAIFADSVESPDALSPVYVNGLRIGGSKASEAVDAQCLWALLALGKGPEENEAVKAVIAGYEDEWGVAIPADLKTIACWKDVRRLVRDAFPTNNIFVLPSAGAPWALLRIRETGEFAVRFMDESQGGFYWFAAWKRGDAHSRVYVSRHPNLYGPAGDKGELSLTGDSLASFYADYVRCGAEWYAEHQFR